MVKYTEELLQEAVRNSKSYAGVIRYLGLRQAGGTQTHLTNKIKGFGIDTSHFTGSGWNKGKKDLPKKSPKDILIVLSGDSHRSKHYQLKRAMLESGVPHECHECQLGTIWMGRSLTLHVDHIDGNWRNNLINNLRFLCPNCHSQQNTGRPHKYAGMVER